MTIVVTKGFHPNPKRLAARKCVSLTVNQIAKANARRSFSGAEKKKPVQTLLASVNGLFQLTGWHGTNGLPILPAKPLSARVATSWPTTKVGNFFTCVHIWKRGKDPQQRAIDLSQFSVVETRTILQPTVNSRPAPHGIIYVFRCRGPQRIINKPAVIQVT